MAQSGAPRASLELRSTATTNSLPGNADAQRDVSLWVRPSMLWRRQSAGLDLDVQAGADLLRFVNHSQPDQSLPFLNAAVKADVVDQWLVIEAAADVRNVETVPFSARADAANARATRRVANYWLSPKLRREFSTHCAVGLVEESGWTVHAEPEVDNVDLQRQRLTVDCLPLPVGGGFELLHEQQRYSLNPQGGWEDTAVRISATAAVPGPLVLGLVLGTERSQFASEDTRTDPIYGMRWTWIPGPRTEFRGEVERRFLGSTWSVGLSHRMAKSMVALNWSSGPASQPPGQSGGRAGADLTALLRSLLTPRQADPQARQNLADLLAAARGLSTDVPVAQDLKADYSQRQSRLSLAWMYLGPRTTLTLSAAWLRNEALSRDGVVLVQTLGPGADSTQRVGAVGLNHLLTPKMSVDASVQWSRVHGLGSRAGSDSVETTGRLTLSQALSPRTAVVYGVQRQVFSSSVTALLPFNANSAFVGIKHRF